MSKYRSSVSRTSSESRDSVYGVKPTRSAKSTDTRRRSVRSTSAGAEASAESAASGKRVPQFPQKRASPTLAAPHTAHDSPKGVPQLMQKATPSGLGVPQTRQFMGSTGPGQWSRILPSPSQAS